MPADGTIDEGAAPRIGRWVDVTVSGRIYLDDRRADLTADEVEEEVRVALDDRIGARSADGSIYNPLGVFSVFDVDMGDIQQDSSG
jgi:hypothetical protein